MGVSRFFFGDHPLLHYSDPDISWYIYIYLHDWLILIIGSLVQNLLLLFRDSSHWWFICTHLEAPFGGPIFWRRWRSECSISMPLAWNVPHARDDARYTLHMYWYCITYIIDYYRLRFIIVIIIDSRMLMRSEGGFLFSFLGVWGWWTVCSSFCFFLYIIASSHCLWGKWEKVSVVTCESTFRVAGVGLCGTQAKVASRVFNVYAVRCLRGKWEKVVSHWRVKVHFAWQACDCVARKRKLLRGSLMFTSPRCLWGKWEKVMWQVWSVRCGVWGVKCGVESVKCEVWSVKCGVWSAECEVWSVVCEVWSVKCGVWSVECEVWSGECEVWSVECEVWSVKCGVWSVKCGVWSVECEVWSVKCGVWSVEWRVWSVKCAVWSVKSGWSVKCGVWSVECEV